MKNIYKSLRALLCAVLCISLTMPAYAGSTVTYIHNDIAGTPVAASDSAGNLLWKENYYPYGEQRTHSGDSTNEVWFHGKPLDSSTGLSYFGARYYDPALGRFMGIDPVGVNSEDLYSFNRYAYGNNNPYKYTDPDGRLVWLIMLPIIEAMGYGAAIGGGLNAAMQYLHTGEVRFGGAGGVVDAATDGATLGMYGSFVSGAAAGTTAEARAQQIHSTLDARAQQMRTTAVTETKEGVRVVSSSQRRLSPAQRAELKSNEVEGVGEGHAEVTGINAARSMGLTPTRTAASRRICDGCANYLQKQGVKAASELKNKGRNK